MRALISPDCCWGGWTSDIEEDDDDDNEELPVKGALLLAIGVTSTGEGVCSLLDLSFFSFLSLSFTFTISSSTNNHALGLSRMRVSIEPRSAILGGIARMNRSPFLWPKRETDIPPMGSSLPAPLGSLTTLHEVINLI